MITKEKLDSKHKQIGNTCLLSNYAVCCNYFTDTDINDYFWDYFQEFEGDFLDLENFFSGRYLLGFFYTDPEFALLYNIHFGNFLIDFKKYLQDHEIEKFMTNYSSIFVCQFHQRTYPDFIPYNYSQASNLDGYTFIKLLHYNIEKSNFKVARDKVRLNRLTKNKDGSFKADNLYINGDKELIEFIKNNEVLLNAFKDMHSYTIYCNSLDKLIYSHNTNDPTKDIRLEENWIKDFNQFLIYRGK